MCTDGHSLHVNYSYRDNSCQLGKVASDTVQSKSYFIQHFYQSLLLAVLSESTFTPFYSRLAFIPHLTIVLLFPLSLRICIYRFHQSALYTLSLTCIHHSFITYTKMICHWLYKAIKFSSRIWKKFLILFAFVVSTADQHFKDFDQSYYIGGHQLGSVSNGKYVYAVCTCSTFTYVLNISKMQLRLISEYV